MSNFINVKLIDWTFDLNDEYERCYVFPDAGHSIRECDYDTLRAKSK